MQRRARLSGAAPCERDDAGARGAPAHSAGLGGRLMQRRARLSCAAPRERDDAGARRAPARRAGLR
jgi:hypothetical protein